MRSGSARDVNDAAEIYLRRYREQNGPGSDDDEIRDLVDQAIVRVREESAENQPGHPSGGWVEDSSRQDRRLEALGDLDQEAEIALREVMEDENIHGAYTALDRIIARTGEIPREELQRLRAAANRISESNITDDMVEIIRMRARRLGISNEDAAENYLAEHPGNRRAFSENVAQALDRLNAEARGRRNVAGATPTREPAERQPGEELVTQYRSPTLGDVSIYRTPAGAEDPADIYGTEAELTRRVSGGEAIDLWNRLTRELGREPSQDEMDAAIRHQAAGSPLLPSGEQRRQVGSDPRRTPGQPIGEAQRRLEERERERLYRNVGRRPLEIGRSMVAEEDPAAGRQLMEEVIRRGDRPRMVTAPGETIGGPPETREQVQQRLLRGGEPRNEEEREMRRRYLEQRTQAPQEREALRRITPEAQARIDAFAREVEQYPESYPGGAEMLEAIRRGEVDVPNSQDDIDAWLARRR